MNRALAALLAASLLGEAAAAPLPSRRSDIVEVVDKVSPAVVNISAEQTVRRRPSLMDEFFFGIDPRPRRSQSLGSGVIIRPEGIVLTNDHVISGASRIRATTRDGRELDCQVVGSDADNDLAVLRVRNSRGSLPTIRLGTSSDLLIGETIIAIGNPFGLSNTVTAGVVSALGRSVPGENRRVYTDFVQIDAPINLGNSGGPVVNIQGEMIGVATSIIGGAQGIGFAIPVDRARRIVDDLLRYGEVRAVWIGVRGQTLTSSRDEIARPGGFRVRSVAPGSPAARGGVRPGDLIVSVDGTPIDSREAFETALSTRGPGRPMRVVLRGSNGERSITVQGQAPPSNIGVQILRDQLGIAVSPVRGGLRINVVDRNGQAAERGIESGDLLLTLNGTRVPGVEEVNRVFQRDYNRTTILMEVGRGRFAYTLTFPLD